MGDLLNLPNEIIIRVFCALSSVQDVLNLAATTSHLNRVFNDRGNSFKILRMAAGIPKSFADDLKRPTAGLAIVGCGEFLVRDGSDQVIHIRVDYSAFQDDEMADTLLLDMLSLRKFAGNRGDSLLKFCYQFYNVRPRCLQPVSLRVEDVLAAASALQAQMLLLKKEPNDKECVFARDNIIAQALDIFAMIQLVGISSYSRLIGKTGYVFTPGSRLGRLGRRRVNPNVEVRKLPLERAPKPLTDDRGNEMTLEAHLYRLCQSMQQMFSRQNLQDSVPLLYTLCILRAAISEVDVHWSTMAGPLQRLAPQRETPMRRVWVDLCRLYFIYSKGTHHPIRFADLSSYPTRFWEDFTDCELRSHFLHLNSLLVQRVENRKQDL